MDLYEINQVIKKIDNELDDVLTTNDIKMLQHEINEIEKEMLDSSFYNNQEMVKQKTKLLSSNKHTIDLYDRIAKKLDELKFFLDNYHEEEIELLKELAKESSLLSEMFNDLEIKVLLNEEYDINDAIVEIHSGAGGTESNDWVEMLYRMYLNFFNKHQFKVEIIDTNYGSEIGLKSVTMRVMGNYAYGYLKNEKGVHRLIRISPFDSNDRRHTTFSLVSISPELDKANDIEIDESDLDIMTYRSSGAGGQSVNTTDSAVRIVHKPSKIVVTCQNQRSQLRNKEEALNVLKNKLMQLEIEKQKELAQQLKGENVDVNFGSQIRSYIFHPYQMVKDHRSNYENNDINSVLDGNLEDIINSVLRINKER